MDVPLLLNIHRSVLAQKPLRTFHIDSAPLNDVGPAIPQRTQCHLGEDQSIHEAV